MTREPAFRDQQAILRNTGRKSERYGQVCHEGIEVAVVDADHRRAHGERTIELAIVVDLDEGIHPERLCAMKKRVRRQVVDASHYDEDAIRAPCSGLNNLVGVEQEILSQNGKSCRLTCLLQVLGCPLKRGRIRKY